jgi:hypothetical protein
MSFFPFVPGSMAPLAVTFTDSDSSGSNNTTYTFTGLSIGTAAATRYVIAGFAAEGGSNPTAASSVTIGGVSATLLSGTGTYAAIYIALVPTGTTATVAITLNAEASRCGVVVWTAANLSSASAQDTLTDTSDPLSGTIDVPSEGAVVAIAAHGNSNGHLFTWTGATEDAEFDRGTNRTMSGAHAEVAAGETGRTVSATTTTSTDLHMVAVSLR